MDDWAPETWVSCFGSAMDKWASGNLNMAFVHFLPNFWHIRSICKVKHAEGLLRFWLPDPSLI